MADQGDKMHGGETQGGRDRTGVTVERADARAGTDYRPDFEVQRVRVDRSVSRNAVRRMLTDHAEYGGWELLRLRRYRDGTRDIWVRRKIIKVRPTFQGQLSA